MDSVDRRATQKGERLEAELQVAAGAAGCSCRESGRQLLGNLAMAAAVAGAGMDLGPAARSLRSRARRTAPNCYQCGGVKWGLKYVRPAAAHLLGFFCGIMERDPYRGPSGAIAPWY